MQPVCTLDLLSLSTFVGASIEGVRSVSDIAFAVRHSPDELIEGTEV